MWYFSCQNSIEFLKQYFYTKTIIILNSLLASCIAQGMKCKILGKFSFQLTSAFKHIQVSEKLAFGTKESKLSHVF